MAGRRMVNSESDPTLNNDNRNMRRPPSSSSVGGMPPMGRLVTPTDILLQLFVFVSSKCG
jgi:FGFR1 oncogene partner